MYFGPQTLPAKCLRIIFFSPEGKMSVVRTENIALAPNISTKTSNIKSSPKEYVLNVAFRSQSHIEMLNNILIIYFCGDDMA